MWGRLSRHWFLLGILVSLTVGSLAAEVIEPIRGNVVFRDGLVFAVMLLTGLSLHPAAVRRSLARPLPSLLAVLINVAWVPLLALPFRAVLPELQYGGLVVATLVPCTLASAAVWTRRAGGDDSIAILTTVVTNLTCVFVVPLGLSWMLNRSTAEFSVSDQMQKLALVVVLPLVVAQLARFAGADHWADRHRLRLSLLAQVGILVMVMIGAAAGTDTVREQAAAGGGSPSATLAAIPLVLMAAIGIHLVALVTGIGLTRLADGDRREQIAVGISGSQKTLMVGLQIAIDCGVSVLPMIVYHVAQLAIDTLIVDRWRRGRSPLNSSADDVAPEDSGSGSPNPGGSAADEVGTP